MKVVKAIFILLLAVSFFTCKQEKQETFQLEENVVVSNEKLAYVEPPNWWVGMKNNELQLLVHHEGIGATSPEMSYSGVTINKVHKADSPNYLFIDLTISETTESGKFDIVFKLENGEELKHTYELKSRAKKPEDYVGFNSSDAIYLITPDRFANANPENDTFESLNEKRIDRADDYARHGGDIQGITNNLDYISEMGFTAIWPCPLLTNDMYEASYHGYAMTNFYEIDPRFGTMEEYLELSQKGKEKGIKLIMDQVANHCGVYHWWMKDLPFSDWLNLQETYESLPVPLEEMRKENGDYDRERMSQYFTNSNHRRTTNQDSYASKYDKKYMSEGWFVPTMPDLNQRNPFMAKYLIQNSIWWVETANLDGIRQDTYPYPDKEFMSDWAGAIMNEYPNFSIVGEEWSLNPLLIGYWQEGAKNKDGYDSNLKSPMDFAMQKNIVDALNKNESWDEGLVKIYEGLANDFHYVSPKDIMIFPDNHDMSRIFTQLNGNIPNTKMALATVLTLPRIPQIYYGTEILMNDFEKPGDHGLIRTDFPGGWQGDTINAFTGDGLTNEQKDMQSFLSTVLNYRKNSKAIHEGKTVHFAPFLGTYFLFRVIDGETVVLILNKNEEPITIDLKRYAEIGLDGKELKNIVTGEKILWKDAITLNRKGATLLTTKTK
ncbi:glycoside hydrolase family 13 protein [Hanstruepera flava]|uniref:glycoside hydrolase family 13 protein n=1 Tax=Hanstruepera flava TaxID=2930218 RepID=UPI0020287F7D|nr:glycoside hydrolase family 13 protein [Hanstruepera flava]